MAGFAVVTVSAQSQNGFSIQVSPSPLVADVKPGETKNLEIKVRNSGSDAEELKIEPRKFTVDKQTGKVELDDSEAPEIAPWISFNPQIFTVKPGEWSTVKIRVSLPKESGFSYSLALVINRTKDPKATGATRVIRGSVAVFTLINVDRPGATRKLEVTDFKTSQTVYEYLPTDLSVSFQNTGNTIVQPYGNIFIQRGSNDTIPIATLPVNDKKGYLLPGTPRTLETQWNDGFPVFRKSTDTNGQQKQELEWNWSKLTDFRIGPYKAKLIAIYNDGQRDVPIEREVTFWVVPWRSILIILLILLVVGYIRHRMIQRKTRRAVKRALEEHDKKKAKTDAS
ncbi:MAG: hypothetical protein WAW80_02640 [Candidatus Saccharimonadales bacterium]